MKFCSGCGGPISQIVPKGDDRLRHVCQQCGTIHYQNPKVVAGCIPEWEGRILLCRRAIEPRHGSWTLPAGYMENGETTMACAARETLEEACAKVEIGPLFSFFSIPHINQIYLIYRGKLLEEQYAPGYESLEVSLFGADDIPWDELAFPVIGKTLELYWRDRADNHQRVYSGDILRRDGKPGNPHFRISTQDIKDADSDL